MVDACVGAVHLGEVQLAVARDEDVLLVAGADELGHRVLVPLVLQR